MSVSKKSSFVAGDHRIEIVRDEVGYYRFHHFEKKYDSEEDIYYEVRVTPDPGGIYQDLQSAACEAERLVITF